jgi:hypothetical protein
MHALYEKERVYLDKNLDGWTEWFKADIWTSAEMRVSLFLVSLLVNGSYVLVVSLGLVICLAILFWR